MSSTSIQAAGLVQAPESRSVGRRALVVVRVLLAVQFAAGGAMKLAATDPMVEMFDDIGVGQWLRVLVGIVEVGVAVGLLVPATVGRAALVVCGLMTGALITRVAVLGGAPVVELLLLGLAAVLVHHHRERSPEERGA